MIRIFLFILFLNLSIKYGHAKLSDGSGFNGCYASHMILRRGTHVVKIPDTISDQCASPMNCSLGTVMCAMEFVPKINNGRAFVQVHMFF
jgi:D-arabinose 1-dehydrogenase-like Zn-dependent alcohol dehydrogenase